MKQLELYNMTQICKILGIVRQTFYNMLKDGLIPEPVAFLATMKLWSKEQIEQIKKNVRCQGKPKSVQ